MSLYDEILSKWPEKFTTSYVSTRHGDTFVMKCGNVSQVSLILLHGAGSNLTSWIGDISSYSRYFNVYLIDIPGEPGRSAEKRLSFNTCEFEEWLLDVFNYFNLKKPSILGISHGAWIAIRFGSCFPDLVEKMVLLTPAGIIPTKFSFIMKAALYSFSGKNGIKRLNRLVFGSDYNTPEAQEYMNTILQNFRSRMEKEYIFSDTELLRLNMPVLFMGGSNDAVRSADKIEGRLKSLLPSVRSVIYPNAGHVLENVSDITVPFLRNSDENSASIFL